MEMIKFKLLLIMFILSAVTCSNKTTTPSSSLVANAGAYQLVDVGGVVSLNGSGSGGDIQSFQWQQIYQRGNSAAPGLTSGETVTFTLDEPDSLEYELTVSDGSSTDSDTCVVRSNLPTITSISPGNGPAGTSVTINGSNFSPTNGQNIVHFNGIEATVIDNSITQVIATVPIGATSGPVQLSLVGTGDIVIGPNFNLVGWLLEESGFSGSLWDLSFPTENVGVAVGSNGTVLRTEDGGDNWTIQNTGSDVELRGVWFTSSLNGVAVGYGGTIVRTIDGGLSWTTPTSNVTVYLYGICFVSNTGWTFGTLSNSRTILIKTTDGGATWTQPDTLYDFHSEGIFFADESNGWMCGSSQTDPVILRTTDGGNSWLPAQTIPTGVYTDELYFVNSTTGWGVGSGISVINTIDGGITWIDQSANLPSGAMNSAYDVFFLNQELGVVVGTGGFIYRTEDGGNSWVDEPNPAGGTNLHSVALINTVEGIVVGGIYSPTMNAFIARRE